MVSKKGLVIALDGPDGVGKTTQIKLTAKHLREAGYKVHVTRFSGGTPIGKLLRNVSLSKTPRTPETDLYISLALSADLSKDLQGRKSKGEICLVDRSPMTVIAYQYFADKLSDKEQGYRYLTNLINDWDLDSIIFLNADQRVLDKRRKARTDKPNDYFETRGTAYHLRVRAGYEAAAGKIKKSIPEKLSVVNAGSTIEDVQTSVQKIVKKML